MGRPFAESSPGPWYFEREHVPNPILHGDIIFVLRDIFQRWAASRGAEVIVCSNFGCRWDPTDALAGIAPDLAVLEPPPPEGMLTTFLQVWKPGHRPPRLAVEIVSRATSDKDYLQSPVRCACLGTPELWIFDPQRLGSRLGDGPHLLQIWRRAQGHKGRMERIHAGEAPAFSPELGAWLHVTEKGTRLRIADDEEGSLLWPTGAEFHRARADGARARAEAANAETARLRAALEDRE